MKKFSAKKNDFLTDMNAEFMQKRQMKLELITMPSFINVANSFDVFHYILKLVSWDFMCINIFVKG
jgi:hypothetical protein